MKVTTQHPQYIKWYKEWQKCRRCHEGQKAIKDAGVTYLPKLTGQTDEEYTKYKNRALFYSITSKSIGSLVGLATNKEPIIKHPEQFDKYFKENSGTQFYEALGSCIGEVLLMGRYGLLIDRGTEGGEPEIHGYTAEQILDWQVDRSGKPYFVKLKEDISVKVNDEYVDSCIYRVLSLEVIQQTGSEAPLVSLSSSKVTYVVTTYDENGAVIKRFIPTNTGIPMDRIPFYAINPFGIGFEVCKPPMLDIADVNISHYMTSADLEHGRHFTGLPTAVVSGVDSNTVLKVGGSTAWVLPDKDAKAFYLEFSGEGLKTLEYALKEKQDQLASLSARMTGASSNGSEAAETVRLRYMSETASLASVVRAVEAALNLVYKTIAEMIGVDPSSVNVALDKSFLTTRMSGVELSKMTAAYLDGGMSVETYVFNLRRGEILPNSRSDQDEIRELEVLKAELAKASKVAKPVAPQNTNEIINPTPEDKNSDNKPQ